MSSLFRFFAIATSAFTLIGCAVAPQAPVQLKASNLPPESRVGIAMTALPKVDLALPGAGCLLCYAAASAANSKLNTHTQSLPYEDLPKLKEQLAQVFISKGKRATVIAEPLDLKSLPDSSTKGVNLATKDFSSFQKKYGIDKLLVVDITALGMERTYASYFPTGAPRGYLSGAGYLVNLNNNTYEWYSPIKVVRSAEGNWDEPPKFPGLTNAYFQVLELSKDEFLKPFIDQ